MSKTIDSLRLTARNTRSVAGMADFARALAARQEWQEAAEVFERVVHLEPSDQRHASECAEAMLEAGRPDEAKDMLLLALAAAPGSAAICEAIGRLHADHFGDPQTAEDWFVDSIKLGAGFEDAYLGLCRISVMNGADPEQAMRTILERLGPVTKFPLIYRTMARALEERGRYWEARAYWQEAPRDVSALLGLTNSYLTTREIEAADRCSCDALQEEPSSFKVHIDRARFLQMTGRITEAQDVIRPFLISRPPAREGELRQWDSSPLDGKTVLLEFGKDSGYGDLIQHCGATARLLQKAGAQVVVECPQRSIHRLLLTATSVSAVVQPFDPRPACDLRIDPAQALCLLAWTWDEIGACVPYFDLPPPAIPFYKPRVKNAFQVGLHWSGREMFQHDIYQHRSMGSEALRELTTLPGVAANSFQLGSASLPPATKDLSSHLQGFTETAAAILTMDLMVTIDSSLAHLAGALGKPCLLMLPYCAAAQWMLAAERADQTPSLWYPNTTLFRQPSPGDWSSVVQGVAAYLQSGKVLRMLVPNN